MTKSKEFLDKTIVAGEVQDVFMDITCGNGAFNNFKDENKL